MTAHQQLDLFSTTSARSSDTVDSMVGLLPYQREFVRQAETTERLVIYKGRRVDQSRCATCRHFRDGSPWGWRELGSCGFRPREACYGEWWCRQYEANALAHGSPRASTEGDN